MARSLASEPPGTTWALPRPFATQRPSHRRGEGSLCRVDVAQVACSPIRSRFGSEPYESARLPFVRLAPRHPAVALSAQVPPTSHAPKALRATKRRILHNTCVTTQKHAKVDERTPVTREMPAQAPDQHFLFALTRRRSGVRDPQRPPFRWSPAYTLKTCLGASRASVP